MRCFPLLASLLIPVALAGCVAPGPGYGPGYGRPAYGGYGGYGGGYRAPYYGDYGGGYRAPAYRGYGYGGGYREPSYAARPNYNGGGGWGGGQRPAPPQARGSGSPEIDRAIAVARQRQPQQNPPTR